MKSYPYAILFVLLTLVLAACAQPGASTPQTPTLEIPATTVSPTEIAPVETAPVETPEPPGEFHPTAALRARQLLADQLGVDPESIEIRDAGSTQWPDACLGLPQPGEACAEAITPGYGGLLIVEQTQYEFRTDEGGDIVRFIPGAVINARQALAQQLNLSQEQIRIIEFEAVEWADGCLGIRTEGIMCLQVITPGYRIVLEGQGERYVYHTDERGDQVLLAEGPQPDLEDAPMVWTGQSDAGCQTAFISSGNIAFGPCNRLSMAGQFSGEDRQRELEAFLGVYAPFEAKTPSGAVTFRGQGSRQATPEEQRMLAEWGRLVYVEALGGRRGDAYGVALAWHREGGIAGFCDNLNVYLTGEVVASSCRGAEVEELAHARLDAAQLARLYGWYDTIQGFEFEQSDPPMAADAMLVRVVFSGTGDRVATDVERLEMLDFGSDLHTELTEAAASDAEDQARQALEAYFSALNQTDYAKAVRLYGGGYQNLRANNPDVPQDAFAELLEAACTFNGFLCDLTLREIVSVTPVRAGEYRFTVEFSLPDGSLFELGPCCGADPASAPPMSQFEYHVFHAGDGFRVRELPVYVP